MSNDATLSALSLSDGTLNPDFHPDTLEYTASVDNSISRVAVSATTNNPDASVAYLDRNDQELADADPETDGFHVMLAPGPNLVRVRVTAQDRTTTKDYTLTVTRPRTVSNDATLSALSLSDGTLDPDFHPDTLEYTASVDNSISRVAVSATTNNPDASVAYLDRNDQELADADPETDGFHVMLAPGPNLVKVRVTAQDRTTAKDYTLTVTRPRTVSNDATLSALSLSDGTLDPDFHPDTLEYTASVDNSISRVAVSATTNNPAASVAYLDRNDQELADADPETDGFHVMLAPGPNLVKVRVTAQDRTTTKDYTLTVTRPRTVSNDATLSALSLSDGTLNPDFHPDTLEYTASVDNSISRVAVSATTNDPAASVAYLDRNDQELTDADPETDWLPCFHHARPRPEPRQGAGDGRRRRDDDHLRSDGDSRNHHAAPGSRSSRPAEEPARRGGRGARDARLGRARERRGVTHRPLRVRRGRKRELDERGRGLDGDGDGPRQRADL